MIAVLAAAKAAHEHSRASTRLLRAAAFQLRFSAVLSTGLRLARPHRADVGAGLPGVSSVRRGADARLACPRDAVRLPVRGHGGLSADGRDRKSTRLNSSHVRI